MVHHVIIKYEKIISTLICLVWAVAFGLLQAEVTLRNRLFDDRKLQKAYIRIFGVKKKQISALTVCQTLDSIS